MSGSAWQFIAICKDCLLFSSSGFFLAYALLVLFLSLAPIRAAQDRAAKVAGLRPPFVGELGALSPPRPSIAASLLQLVLRIASFNFFAYLIRQVLDFIRAAFLMGDAPTFARSFLRFLVFYLIVIPLPAAFMPPVGDAQRKPDFQLMAAVVLLIMINALGDAISVRITLRKFSRLQFEKTTLDNSLSEQFWASARNEIVYYLAVLRGALYSLMVLVGVLALSSVLYGVQIGQLDFGLTQQFFAGAAERVWRTPSLAFEFYWFRDQPGPFGLPGIPGLFLYGLTTFIPMIALFALGIVWLLFLPFRIAVNFPGSAPLKVVSSEVALIAICIAAEETLKVNLLNTYIFLMHAWTT